MVNCSVETCSNQVLVKSKQLCSGHYRRLITYGSVHAEIPLKKRTVKPRTPGCKHAGCDNPHYARSLCKRHYDAERERRYALARIEPDLDGERWKPIAGFDGRYSVSDFGRVKRHRYDIVRAGHTVRFGEKIVGGRIHRGYHYVHLPTPEGTKAFRVHRLVMAAFVGPCPEGMEVCHNNGVSNDNRLANLRYDTRSANNLDQVRHGTHPFAGHECCPNGHEYTAENTYVGSRGRNCRICMRRRGRVQDRKRRARKKAQRAS